MEMTEAAGRRMVDGGWCIAWMVDGVPRGWWLKDMGGRMQDAGQLA